MDQNKNLFIFHMCVSKTKCFQNVCLVVNNRCSKLQEPICCGLRILRCKLISLLVVPRSKLKRHGDRSLVAPVLWNSLPESMKSSISVASFKRTLKTFNVIIMRIRILFLETVHIHISIIYVLLLLFRILFFISTLLCLFM